MKTAKEYLGELRDRMAAQRDDVDPFCCGDIIDEVVQFCDDAIAEIEAEKGRT